MSLNENKKESVRAVIKNAPNDNKIEDLKTVTLCYNIDFLKSELSSNFET